MLSIKDLKKVPLPKKGAFRGICNEIYNYYYAINNIKPAMQLKEKKYTNKVPKGTGIYIFYYRNKPFYIGISDGPKGIYGRVIHNHLSGASTRQSSPLRKKLIENPEWRKWREKNKIKDYKQLRKWLFDNCKFKFKEIKDIDSLKLLETFLVKLWRNDFLVNN